MKKILNSLFISAFALTALYSCQKEIALTDEQPVSKEPAIMTVQAQSIVTKTFVEKVSDSEYNLKWSAGDAIACYEVGVVEEAATVQGKVTSSALAADAATASFTMDFSGNPGAPNYSYIFVYPAAKYTKSGEIYRAQIPDKQTFSATTFDKDADVLISRAITDQTTRPTTVSAEFERIGATALMNIKAPTTTEKIRSITFSTTETSAYLAGYVKVYPLTGTHDIEIYSGGTDGRSITLTPASSTTYTGTIPVWFRLGEITLSDNFTVVVTTNKKIYTKTVDLASASRTLEFNNSGLTKFNVNMASVVGVDNPYVEDGVYYIVAPYNGNYFALSSTANGSRLDKVQLNDFEPSASSYLGSNSAIEWTVTNEDEKLVITSAASKYLNSGSKAASTTATKQYFTVSVGSVSGSLRLNSVSNSGYGLRYNTGGPYFAFYDSDPNASMIGDVYFMPKDSRSRVAAPSNVDADAIGTDITVIWKDATDANIDHYLVKLSGEASDEQEVAVGEEVCEFTGLSDGTYSVSVEAVPSNLSLYVNSLPETVSGLIIGSVDVYTKVTSLTAGASYLFVETSSEKVATGAISSKTLQTTSVTLIGGSTIEATDTIDGYAITITALTGTDAGYYTMKCGSNYIGYGSSSTDMASATSVSTDKYKWSISIDAETGVATILNKSATTRYIGYNGSTGFKAYSNGSGYSNARPVLFKK